MGIEELLTSAKSPVADSLTIDKYLIHPCGGKKKLDYAFNYLGLTLPVMISKFKNLLLLALENVQQA